MNLTQNQISKLESHRPMLKQITASLYADRKSSSPRISNIIYSQYASNINIKSKETEDEAFSRCGKLHMNQTADFEHCVANYFGLSPNPLFDRTFLKIYQDVVNGYNFPNIPAWQSLQDWSNR